MWLLAGPDGVGKTRYAFRHIRAVTGTVRFVNLDEIARGLSPTDADAGRIEAARIALDRVEALLRTNGGSDFTIETTLSGLSKRDRPPRSAGPRPNAAWPRRCRC